MKLKVVSIELLSLLLFFSVRGQQWIRIYGDSINTLTYHVHEHYDKGYIFTGKQEEGWTSYGWVMKTDINGYRLWTKSFGLPGKINPVTASRITNEKGIIAIAGTNNISSNCTDPIIYKITTDRLTF